jgi:hypothetical protein
MEHKFEFRAPFLAPLAPQLSSKIRLKSETENDAQIGISILSKKRSFKFLQRCS